MQGNRRPDGIGPAKLEIGDYARWGGSWYARCPSGHCANLGNHEVVTHEDGTITVSPSILVSQEADQSDAWHGYLERGVWREC